MNNPLVTIIIPVLNRADLICDTLYSVLAQTYQNWECIVVDDGSTDKTKEVVQQFVEKDLRFILISRPDTHKSGANGARNYGFQLSKGEYIQWFDSDDIMDSNFIFEKIKKFDDFTDCVICRNRYRNTISGIEIPFPYKTNFNFDDVVTSQMMIQTAAPLWRKDFLQKKQLWDESLFRLQDWDFNVRMFSALSNRYHFIDKQLFIYNFYLDSIVGRSKDLNEFKYRTQARIKIYNYLEEKSKLNKDLKYWFLKDILELYPNIIKSGSNLDMVIEKFIFKKILNQNIFAVIFKFKILISKIIYSKIHRGNKYFFKINKFIYNKCL